VARSLPHALFGPELAPRLPAPALHHTTPRTCSGNDSGTAGRRRAVAFMLPTSRRGRAQEVRMLRPGGDAPARRCGVVPPEALYSSLPYSSLPYSSHAATGPTPVFSHYCLWGVLGA
jgi:hypothetical protein